ncbi:MAG: tyrosine-type recombinase/integrase [Selenomonadaceae bacterium]|nr:tyrosine-type recombinase/integrase [Selenomonadaceae bacterium]
MALRKIRLTWYAYFRDDSGKIRTISLHTRDEATATKLHREVMARIAAVKTFARLQAKYDGFFPGKPTATETITAPTFPESSAKRLRLDKMIAATRQRREVNARHAAAFERFVASVAPLKYADEITPKIALDYLDKTFGKATAKTYNNNLTMLNVMFRTCAIRAGLNASPFANIPRRLPSNVSHFRPLTVDEFRAIFAAAAEPWKTASIIAWHTGLRLETCFKLSWSHIDEADRSFTIMPGKTARFGRAVYVPIHPELWQHLNSLTRPTDPLQPILSQWQKYIHFPGHKNQTYFAGMLHALGIKDTCEGKAGFHSFRASFITRCDEAGISRRATKGIAGHTTDDMTDLYSHDRATARQILTLPNVLDSP